MIASLLTQGAAILDNVPRLADVIQLQRILGNHGVDVMIAGKRPGDDPNQGRTIHISAMSGWNTRPPTISFPRCGKLRVVAPLLARMGEAKVSMPGGCAIGTRPVDSLILVLQSRAEFIESGYVIARAPKGLRGGEIVFPSDKTGQQIPQSMAASLAYGSTVIENAAREPEIGDVADRLYKMGAQNLAGTSRIVIEGVSKLHGARHSGFARSDRDRHLRDGRGDDRGGRALCSMCSDLLQAALDVVGQAVDHCRR